MAAEAQPLAPQRSYPQLRPRRKGPSPEKVARHQRARLYAAMIDSVAERGYAATTVSELRARAGVSKRTIYDQFSSKEAFFLTTYDQVVLHTIRRIDNAYRSEQDWFSSLGRAFEAFVAEVLSRPQAARLALIEARAAGPAALAATERTNRTFERMLAASLQQAPDGVVLPRAVITGVVAGIARVMRRRLLDNRVQQALAEELLDWAITYRSAAALQLRVDHAGREPSSLDTSKRAEGQDAECQRILRATTRLVAAYGYGELTVARILQDARVGDECFFDRFTNSEQCFKRALDGGISQANVGVSNALTESDWTIAVQRAMHALLAHLECHPDLAQSAFVEVLKAGSDCVGYSETLLEGSLGLIEKRMPHSRRSSEQVRQAITGAVWELIHQYVAHGSTARLTEIGEYLCYLVLAPAIGPQRALVSITAARPQVDLRANG